MMMFLIKLVLENCNLSLKILEKSLKFVVEVVRTMSFIPMDGIIQL